MTRVAVVTGGTRGIGAAICQTLQSAGMKVAANYCGNDSVAQDFSDRYHIPAFKWDVSDYDACQDGISRIESQLGPVDVLVNNAGITRDATILKLSYAQWREVIDVNLGGCFNMAKAVFDGMKKRRFGRIVNISSVNGQAGQIGQSNYAAAKSGVHGLTKVLAQEGARSGITVNTVAPGYCDTDMVAAVPSDVLQTIISRIPVGRLGQAEEVAHSVSFLCAEHAGFITGSTLSINGGLYMH